MSLLFSLSANRDADARQRLNLTPQDLAHGRQIFAGQCSPCHGTNGKGANLALPSLKHAANDAALFEVIRRGIDDTGMPGNSFLADRELWMLVAYVRSLGRTSSETLPGNPA